MFHSDSDLTLTLTFPFEAELVLKFPGGWVCWAGRVGVGRVGEQAGRVGEQAGRVAWVKQFRAAGAKLPNAAAPLRERRGLAEGGPWRSQPVTDVWLPSLLLS